MAKSKRAQRLAELAAQISVCTKCPLHESRTLAVPGDGQLGSKVMIIGEAPGREEDESGHPFVGSAGRYLDHVLEGTGLDRGDFFITNTVKCRPPKNRTPKRLEVETCTSNYLFEQTELIAPRLIVLLGGVAAKKILGVKSVNDARGRIIAHEGRKYLVGYHPAVRFYREDLGEKVKEDFALLKRELKKMRAADATGGQARQKTQPKKAPRAGRAGVKKDRTAPVKGDRPVTATARAFKGKELSGDLDVKIGSGVVSLTNLDKPYWPDDGYTKGDLIRYYYEVAKYIGPYLKDRPLIMKRYPNGINGPSFHQHDVDEAPDYVRTASIDVEEGHVVDYLIGDNLATLLYVANLGAIERHPWHSRVADLDHPDWFVFDLDPGKDVEFTTICEVALGVREVLGRLGLECYAKTSGSRGLHVYVPIKPQYSYDQVADFSERVARLVVGRHPEAATVERSLKKRKGGSIYVDHLQNARGKSVVAPYSVRPRAGATVSAPLEWAEVQRKKVTPQDFTIKNMLRRLDRKGDLFKPVLTKRQSLAAAIEQIQQMT